MSLDESKKSVTIYIGRSLAGNVKVTPAQVTGETEKQYKVGGTRINKSKINTVTATGTCYSLSREGAIKLLLKHNKARLEHHKASIECYTKTISTLNDMLNEQ
jgi:hypothetical protein